MKAALKEGFLHDGTIFDDVDEGETIAAAIDARLRATAPRAAAKTQALSQVFDAEWNALEYDVRRAAFLVGMDYGRRAGKAGAR